MEATFVHCKNCKTVLVERFPLFQGKIAIMFDKHFLKAQGLLRSEWPKLRESSMTRQFNFGRNKELWCRRVSDTIKLSATAVCAEQTRLKGHVLHKGAL